MRPYFLVGELSTGQPDKWAACEINPAIRMGDGCSCIIRSLHQTKGGAQQWIEEMAHHTPKETTHDYATQS